MKKLKIGLLLFTLSMFFITCKKEHIEPSATNGTPVFYFNGTVNGSSVSLDAGVSNYYMYSSYTQSPGGLYSFTGTLQQVSNNKSSIQFTINDKRQLSIGGAETDMTAALDTGSYNYSYIGGTPMDSAIFSPSWGTDTTKSYTYSFGDGNTLNGTGTPIRCSHIYSRPSSNYNASLSVLFTDGFIGSASNQFNLSSSTSLFTDSIIKQDSGSGPTVNFQSWALHGTGNYSYYWYFDDTASDAFDTSTSNFISHTFKDTLRIHHVSLKITDLGNGDTVITYVNTGCSKSTRKHFVNYDLPGIYSVPNKLGLSNVTIVYYDPSGQMYTTKDSAQSASSNFHVLSVSNYQNNENNQTTKMLHVKFNCTLYNSSGGSIAIKNGDAIIAVAYK